MVLESLTTPERAESKPWDMVFLGVMYGALAVFLSLWVFKEEASIIMVLLTVIVCIPLIHNTLRFEEGKDDVIAKELVLLREHWHALSFFVFLFVGFVIAYSVAYIALPADVVSLVFSAQERTINQINQDIATGSVKLAESRNVFLQILSNNVKVFMFCIFFSFFYGAGAIFILTWNASVISAAIGNFFRVRAGELASSLGLAQVAGYFQIYGLSILRYFIHGIPEILGYFVGALAGGIISVAVIQHDIGSYAFKHTMKDSLNLVVLGLVVLLVAAVIEVFVTPVFF